MGVCEFLTIQSASHFVVATDGPIETGVWLKCSKNEGKKENNPKLIPLPLSSWSSWVIVV